MNNSGVSLSLGRNKSGFIATIGEVVVDGQVVESGDSLFRSNYDPDQARESADGVLHGDVPIDWQE